MFTGLREIKSLLAAMKETFMVSITDARGVITFVNEHFLEISRYERHEIIGQNHSVVKTNHHSDDFFREMWSELSKDNVWRGEICNKAKNGTEYWLDLMIIPVKDASQGVYHYVGIGNPITDRKLTERSLARTLKDLGDLKLALDESSIVAITDRRGVITYVNDRFCAISGYNKEELIGNTHRIVNSRYHPQTFFQDMWRTIASGDVWRGEIKNRAKDGSEYWVSTTIVPFMDEFGKPYQYVSIRYDITDRIRAQERLAEAMQHDFRRTVKNLHNGIFKIGYNAAGDIVYTLIEGKLAAELGLTTENAAYRPIVELHGSEIARKLEEHFHKVKQGLAVNIERSYQGRYYYISLSPMEEDGVIEEAIGSVIDITDRKQAEQKVYHLAHYDVLTNLPNRVLFNQKLSRAIQEAEQRNEPIAILFMDLDRFKTVNDTLGHSHGDELLRSVADRLVAQSDGMNGLISRVGGDEFTFYFTNTTREEAGKISERFIESMAEPFDLNQMHIYVTPSIGISMYPDDGEEIEILLKNADAAMYMAKGKGKNNYQFYEVDSQQMTAVKLLLESELHKALDEHQLFLEYQPIVDLKAQTVVGMEALLRWRHPVLGIVPPMQFVPLAEETGLIVPIGEWVMREACRQTRAWQEQGLGMLRIAVNISMRQFMQNDFCAKIGSVLAETGLAPEYLELEITESMAQDADYAIRVLRQIKELNVTISIDDFGTGYSSLSYLSRFPIDRLKIDRSFVSDLNRSNRAIIKTIIDMAANMDISVVAEGVETKEHVEFLLQQRCQDVQGYYYSMPLSEVDAELLLRRAAASDAES